MQPHPSLTASPIKIEPIVPVPSMGRNESCWCRSGLKYKKCHLNRELQKPINIFEMEARLVAEARVGYCSHPDPSVDPCTPKVIKSHTVQKGGGIAAIAEVGHVLTVKPIMKDMMATNGNPQPRRIGVNSASVFPGFCNKHDTSLFKSIEGSVLTLDKDSAFLFSYRAIAYERFSKEAQWRGMAAFRQADRGQSLDRQGSIQSYLAEMFTGALIGRRDVDGWKKLFDDRLLSGKRDDFHFVAVRFDTLLPIVAAGALHPEFDFQGNALQRLGRDGVEFEHITMNVTSFGGQTVAVFGWIASDHGPASALAKSFLLVDDVRKADALVRFLFIHTDNLFMRPTWWDALPNSTRTALNTMTKSGTTMRMRFGKDLADDRIAILSACIVETVTG